PPPGALRWHYPVQVRGVPGRTRFSGILPPRRHAEYTTAGASAQASVSWRPGLAITRGSAPSIHFAPGLITTEAERTWNDSGSRPGAGVPRSGSARAAVSRTRRD